MKLEKLTDIQYNILIALETTICYGYSWFENKYTRKEYQKEVKNLRELGYIEYVKGLMNDDNEVCGSGFSRMWDKDSEIDKLVNKYEKESDKELISKSFFDD